MNRLHELDPMSRGHKHNLTEEIEAMHHLHVGVVASGRERHEPPHKPVLLLAVINSI